MNKKYKYKFSIIMSVYNVEKWIEEAIESLINQTIGFEDNVQLILVNDGSTDNSEKICLKYKEMYPDNISYFYKENGGVSSAKNMGLKHIKGKYINFLDPDDFLSENALEEVYNFFEKNYILVDFVSIPLYLFEAKTGIHGKYKYMGDKNKIINLLVEPYNFVLSSAASFYKSDVFETLKFSENLSHAEDLEVNMELYKNNPNFGYVCSNNVKYFYRQRFDNSSIVTSGNKSESTFVTIVNLFKGECETSSNFTFMKEIMIYQLKNVIKHLEENIFVSRSKYDQTVKSYKNIINNITIEYLINESFWCRSIEEKLLFCDFYFNNPKYILKDNGYICIDNESICIKFLSNVKLKIYNVTYEGDKLCIDILTHDYNIENLKLYFKNSAGVLFSPDTQKSINSPYDMKISDKILRKTKYYKFKLPLDKTSSYEIYAGINETCLSKMKKIVFSQNCALGLNHSKIGLFNNGRQILFNKNKSIFNIIPKKSSRVFYLLESTLRILKRYKKFVWLRLFSLKNKKFILISERPEKAGDNAEALFRYIYGLEKKDRKNIYFAISKKSNDYKKLKKYGKVINKNGLLHKYIYLNSKTIVTSHIHPLFYKPFANAKEDTFFVDLLDYKLFWLQHGVTKDDISQQANKFTRNISKVIVATKEERKEFLKEKYFYSNDDVLLTGFPRFDLLQNKPRNVITVVPTWRKGLTGRVLEDGKHEKIEGFERSEYFLNYQKILTSEKIKKLLKENKCKLKFLLHPGMSEYQEYFDCFNDKNIEIIYPGNVNYSDMFKESKLIVTDYSSIFFDFAYLKKPLVFFQFDKGTFFKTHYLKGYFDYERDAFGDVLTTVEQVVEKIEFYFKNDFKMEKKYIKRVENTFEFLDKNNCKRVYEEILKLDDTSRKK